jgi:type IV pilus assembly protein PilC
MNTFEVIYREPGHQATVVRKQIKGHAEALVRRDMEAQGNRVLAIMPVNDSGFGARMKRAFMGNLNISLRFGVSTAELALLCEVLKALYSSGVPMLESFQIVIDETPNAWLRKRLIIVLERLRDGADIYEAMSDPRCRKAFPPLMRETIRTGEANGRLDRSLERLADIYKRAAETRRETISALLYPVFAFIIFIVVCSVIAIVIPDELEKAVGAKNLEKVLPRTPLAIRTLFYLRENKIFLAIPPAAIIVLSLLWTIGKRYRPTRIALTRVERRVPLIGKILYQFALVRFLDLLASNNETGIQVAESLRLIKGSIDDALIEESLERMRINILSAGAGLGEALNAQEEREVYPGLIRQMVRAGEEAGRMTEMLLPIVDYYGQQAKATLKRMLDLLTPVMIVLLGAIIGPVLIGLYKTLILLQDVAAFGV